MNFLKNPNLVYQNQRTALLEFSVIVAHVTKLQNLTMKSEYLQQLPTIQKARRHPQTESKMVNRNGLLPAPETS